MRGVSFSFTCRPLFLSFTVCPLSWFSTLLALSVQAVCFINTFSLFFFFFKVLSWKKKKKKRPVLWQFPFRFPTYLANRDARCSKTVRLYHGMEDLMHTVLSALLLLRNDLMLCTVLRLRPLVDKSRVRAPWYCPWLAVIMNGTLL